MPQFVRRTTPFEYLRAYTALSRSGYVTEAIRACEEAWGRAFEGDPTAVDAVRRLPEYESYARALRASLCFPLTLYRVSTAEAYRAWRSGRLNRPVATSLSAAFARLIREVSPEPRSPLIVFTGALLDPEAVIMRGRVEGYELVLDTSRLGAVDIQVLAD